MPDMETVETRTAATKWGIIYGGDGRIFIGTRVPLHGGGDVAETIAEIVPIKAHPSSAVDILTTEERAALIVRAVNSFPALQRFVQAYDAWRQADDALEARCDSNEDINERELREFASDEAVALVALIEARAALSAAGEQK